MPPIRAATPSCALILVVMSACAQARRARGDDGWDSTPGPPAPVIEQRPPAPRDTVFPPERRVRWERAEEIGNLRMLPLRGASEHGDSLERTVAINEAAASYAAAHIGPLPAGALVLQRHHRPGQQAVESIYVMIRRDSHDWEFVVLDPELRVAARGALASCTRCHREAPHDGLFGPVRSEPEPAPPQP